MTRGSFGFKGFNGAPPVKSGFPSLEIRTYNQEESKLTGLGNTDFPKSVTESGYGRSPSFL